jgi:hypothetical protein
LIVVEEVFEREGPAEECECCGYEYDLAPYMNGWPRREFWLCEVCATTGLAKSVEYPMQCPDPWLYRCVARGINMILDAIDKEEA